MSQQSRKPRFEGETTIVIPGRRDGDVTILVVVGLLALLVFYSLLVGSGDRENQVYGGLMLAFLIWVAIAPAWRLMDRQALLRADADGLIFHPSISTSPVAWSDVGRITLETETARGLSFSFVRLRLNERRASLESPFWSDSRKVRLRQLGLSYRDAEDLLRQLRCIRSANDHASRDQALVS